MIFPYGKKVFHHGKPFKTLVAKKMMTNNSKFDLISQLEEKIAQRDFAIKAIKERFQPGTLIQASSHQARRVIYERRLGYNTDTIAWPYARHVGIVIDVAIMNNHDEFNPKAYLQDSELYVQWFYPTEPGLTLRSSLSVSLFTPYTKASKDVAASPPHDNEQFVSHTPEKATRLLNRF